MSRTVSTTPKRSPRHISLPGLEQHVKPSSTTTLCFTNPLQLAQEKGLTSLNPNAVAQMELTVCRQKHNDEFGQEVSIKEVTVNSKKVRGQRLWTTVLSTIVACMPFLLAGCTLGFPSGAILDLTDLEKRTEFKLTREQADLFGVSHLHMIATVCSRPMARS